MAVTRTEIRKALKELVSEYVSPYFGSYPTVNIKDYDIAGLNKAEYYPVVNILSKEETYLSNSIGKSDRDMKVYIDVIPWGSEEDGMEIVDKVFQEFPNIIFSNPGLTGNAIDSTIERAYPLSLGTDCPTFKVRFELIIRYRESRPI